MSTGARSPGSRVPLSPASIASSSGTVASTLGPVLLSRNDWVADKDASACHQCARPFSIFFRRHHCRMCGNVFCETCSSKRVGGHRACRTCFQRAIGSAVASSVPVTDQEDRLKGKQFSSPYPFRKPQPVQTGRLSAVRDDTFSSFVESGLLVAGHEPSVADLRALSLLVDRVSGVGARSGSKPGDAGAGTEASASAPTAASAAAAAAGKGAEDEGEGKAEDEAGDGAVGELQALVLRACVALQAPGAEASAVQALLSSLHAITGLGYSLAQDEATAEALGVGSAGRPATAGIAGAAAAAGAAPDAADPELVPSTSFATSAAAGAHARPGLSRDDSMLRPGAARNPFTPAGDVTGLSALTSSPSFTGGSKRARSRSPLRRTPSTLQQQQQQQLPQKPAATDASVSAAALASAATSLASSGSKHSTHSDEAARGQVAIPGAQKAATTSWSNGSSSTTRDSESKVEKATARKTAAVAPAPAAPVVRQEAASAAAGLGTASTSALLLSSLNEQLAKTMADPKARARLEATAAFTQSSVIQTVESIAYFFESLRYHGPRAVDKFKAAGRISLLRILLQVVFRQEPLQLVLPAFPCKSPNTKSKVLGVLPDRGEEIALQRLHRFCARVSAVYSPGCTCVVFTDGRVFADIVGVDHAAVDRYWDELRKLVPSPYLRWATFDEYLPELLRARAGFGADDAQHAAAGTADARGTGASSPSTFIAEESADAMSISPESPVSPASRPSSPAGGADCFHGFGSAAALHAAAQRFISTAWEPQEGLRQLEADILAGGEHALLYRGFIRFLEQDRDWPAAMSKSAVKKHCGAVAKRMIVRNQNFSKLVSAKFPSAIRLSIHAHNNAGPKYAVRLFDDLPFCVTPWHNAVVRLLDGTEMVMRREDAETKLRCRIVTHPQTGRPWMFEQLPAPALSASPSGGTPAAAPASGDAAPASRELEGGKAGEAAPAAGKTGGKRADAAAAS